MDANLTASGLAPQDLAADLGWGRAQVLATLAVDAADPVDVWLLRDYLDLAARAAGTQPVAYSVLTEHARAAAPGWFPLHDDPPGMSTTT